MTAQVSDLTSSMIERIVGMQMLLGQAGPGNANRAAIKEEVMREIGQEMQRFQRKYEESRELISVMRKNFLKELQHLKMKDSMS